jgi:hypothetical protein
VRIGRPVDKLSRFIDRDRRGRGGHSLLNGLEGESSAMKVKGKESECDRNAAVIAESQCLKQS